MANRVPRDLDTNFDFRFGDKLKKSGEIIVAHSTSSNLLPEILKNGLSRNAESVWENTSSNKLFFEVEPTHTHYGENVYGWKSVQKHGGVPVTLYVKVKQNKLRTDMDDADLGVKYQKNQKECTCDVPPEDILGLNFVRNIDIAPKDFMEFYEMFSDDKMSKGGSFEKSVFIHSAEKENRDSIIKHGLRTTSNPVLVKGIYTFPEQWGHHKDSFSKKEYDYYEIRLKDGAKLFWTDTDRPMDAIFGNGSDEYNQVYDKLIQNTSAKNRETVMKFISGFQGGDNKKWFDWKAEFSREMEKYLSENGYAGIQEGGQIVITDLGSIQSILLNGKTEIKVGYNDKMSNGGKFEDYQKIYDADGSMFHPFDLRMEFPELVYNSFPTQKEIDKLNKWLRDNKDKYVKMYHGSPFENKENILQKGLLPTSSSRRHSQQSQSGFVYLNVFPPMAKNFADIAVYYDKGKNVVFEVVVAIMDLKPDTDQLINKRYHGSDKNIGDTLADSIIYGHGARVRGKIDRNLIRIVDETNPEFFSKGGNTQNDNIILENMENEKDFFTDGGNIQTGDAKPEEIIADEINFDTRKGLNRSDKVVPKEVIEEIESEGVSLERLESLGLPIFKYQTQITVHGIFEGIGSGRIGGYKNLLSNANQTLGIKYNAIDYEKKSIISKALRLDRQFNEIKGGFNSRMDSRGFEIYKRKVADSKEAYAKIIQEFKEESNNIPSNFIGKKIVNAYSVWGRIVVELLIEFKAIKQDNLWSFISAITDGRITEVRYNELLAIEIKKEEEEKKERAEREKERSENTLKQVRELISKTTYPKATEQPKGEDYILAFVQGTYSGAEIKVYYIFKNKTGRKVYYIKNYKNWEDIEKTIDKDKRGNTIIDDKFEKKISSGIEKGIYYLVYEKQKLTSMYEKPTTSVVTKERVEATKPDTDNVLIDTDRYQLIKSKHTKTGDDIYLLKLKTRVERDDYKTIDRNVKNIRGYYSSFVGAFVLKTAISANEIEKLLEGTSLELKRNNDSNTPDQNATVENSKVEEIKEEAIKDVVEGTNLTVAEATEQVEKGVAMEEEHRETLEKLAKGEVTVDEAVAGVATDHIINEDEKYYTKHEETDKKESTDEKLYDVYFKVWNLSLDEIKKRAEDLGIPVGGVWNYLDGTPNKIHFENITKEQVEQLRKINIENDAIFYSDDAGSNSALTPSVEEKPETKEIEMIEGKTEDGKDVYGANIKYKDEHIFIPLGRYETKEEVEARAKKIVEELKSGDLGEELQELIRREAVEEQEKLDKVKAEYPIVIEMSEGLNQRNLGFDYLHQLEKKVKEAGLTDNPTETYIKTKVWFKDYPNEGDYSYVTILNSYKDGEFNPEQEEGALMEYLKKYSPSFDWDIYEYGSKYKFGTFYTPEPKYKEGDLARITIDLEDGKYDYVYGFIIAPTKFNRADENWKPHWEYDVRDKFDSEKIYKDVFEHRISLREENEITEEINRTLIDKGEAPLLSSEEAVSLSQKYIEAINKEYAEYTESGKANTYWKERYETNILEIFNKWFEDVICRYPIMLSEFLNIQVDKLPNYKKYLLNGFITFSDSEYPNQKQFFNSLMKSNVGKQKLVGLYDLLPNILIYDKKTPKQLDWELEPSSEELFSILKPIVGDDDLRPVMAALNFDEHGVTATDAHKLFFLYGKTKKIGIYAANKVAIESGQFKKVGNSNYYVGKNLKYPKYENVIPVRFNDVVTLDRSGVEKIVKLLRTFKNASYYNLSTGGVHISLYRGEANYFNIHFLLDVLETWLKIGFDTLEFTYRTLSRHDKNNVRNNILMISPNMDKFTRLKGSGSIMMGIAFDDSGNSIHDINQTEMYIDFTKGIAPTAGVNDDLYTENNPAFGTEGAIEEVDKIKEVEDMIELLEMTLAANPNDVETQDMLELNKITLANLKASNTEKFAKGGSMKPCGCIHAMKKKMEQKFENGGGINSDSFGVGSVVYFNNNLRGEIIDVNGDNFVISRGIKCIDVPKENVIGLAPKNLNLMFDDGGTIHNDRVNEINNTTFYRYYPMSVNPFEVSFDGKNKYGYGIYFLDNPYYYKNKFENARLISIKPRVQNPMIFMAHRNQIPNYEYAAALLSAIQHDNVKDRDAFTRKMIEAGYDSLVVVEPRGTYLIMFFNDTDLYSIDSDTNVEKEEFKKHENISDKLSDEEVNEKYNELLSAMVLASDIDEDEVEELSIEQKRKILKDNSYGNGGGLKANDIPLHSWLQHKKTKVKVKVWNVDPQLGKMQVQDIYGNKDKQWRSASDWKLIPEPTSELEEIKKVWAEQGSVFEYNEGGKIINVPENLTDEDVLKLAETAKSEINDALSKLYAERDFHGTAIRFGDKSKAVREKFDDVTNRISYIQNKEKSIDEIISKYKKSKGGLIIDENWGNDGSTPSNNEDYNNLYALFPDNHSEAKAIWSQLSEKQKEGFLHDLRVTDAASEHIEESWLEFVNAKSEKDWLENATNWDEMKDGGSINEIKTKEKLINILSSLDKSDLSDFVYHIGGVDVSYVDDIVSGYENWVNGLEKDELDMLLWKMKQPYFYEFSPKDNYSTPTPVPSKFATYNDFYEKKYKNGGGLDKRALKELKLLGFSDEEIKYSQIYQDTVKDFGDVIKVKDLPNIKNGDMLGYIYKHEDARFGDARKGKVSIEAWGKDTEWGIDAYPFNVARAIKGNENNPEFELKNIPNGEHEWTLYHLKK